MALIVASVAAPAASWFLFLTGSLIVAVMQQPGPSMQISQIGLLLLWTLLIAAWGFLPAFAFGGVAMAAIARWFTLRGPFIHPVAGLIAAAAYVAVGILFAKIWSAGAFLFAPWAMVMEYPSGGLQGSAASVAAIGGCILMAGAVGGGLYQRLAQRG